MRTIAGVDIDFVEGDAEALPYPDGAFDVVLSQFGHIFAPRPAIAVREMLRVLKTGGRIAFSTWPPELFLARFLAFIPRFLPPPPPGAATPESPVSWGDPNVIRERLGDAVTALRFERDTMIVSTLSPQHFRLAQERAIGQLAKAIDHVQNDPARLAELRTGIRGPDRRGLRGQPGPSTLSDDVRGQGVAAARPGWILFGGAKPAAPPGPTAEWPQASRARCQDAP